MPDISESLKKLQEIKDMKDRRQKYFNIYFYVQLALNVLIDVTLVISVLKLLSNDTKNIEAWDTITSFLILC
jgi:predicted nucleic acid-binding Zn ribbon protein